MEPVAVWVRRGGEWAIIHRCKRCGALSSNRVAADDNPMKLMSIAMRPLCEPPFPLERIEEMTALMAGDGRMKQPQQKQNHPLGWFCFCCYLIMAQIDSNTSHTAREALRAGRPIKGAASDQRGCITFNGGYLHKWYLPAKLLCICESSKRRKA